MLFFAIMWNNQSYQFLDFAPSSLMLLLVRVDHVVPSWLQAFCHRPFLTNFAYMPTFDTTECHQKKKDVCRDTGNHTRHIFSEPYGQRPRTRQYIPGDMSFTTLMHLMTILGDFIT